jgi:hypothetical protein
MSERIHQEAGRVARFLAGHTEATAPQRLALAGTLEDFADAILAEAEARISRALRQQQDRP